VSRKKANTTFGFITGVGACCTSGFAGVYTEMRLKQSGVSMWVRSAQLCVFCMASSLFFSYVEQGYTFAGFWHGFTPITWAPILCESLGGVLTALVLKHADSVLKSFAIGLAIVLSTAVSFFFFDFALTVRFMLGAPLVILSLFIYNVPAKVSPTPTSTRSALSKKDD
jgi:UDP-sugar transporter A1/2/3